MKPTKHNIKLTLQKGLVLSVKGEYVPEEPMVWTYRNGDPGHPGSPSEFIIEDVQIEEGTVMDLLDWNDGWFYAQISDIKEKIQQGKNVYPQSLFEYLSELCIKKIENE